MPGRMGRVENLYEAAVPGSRIRGWFSTLPTAPWKSLTRFPQFHSPNDDDPLLRTSKTRGHFYWALTVASVLRSNRAVQANIAIMRAFVSLREMMATHKDLVRKLEAMERKYDARFKVVFDAMRKLMEPPPEKPKKTIGFQPPKK